MINPAHNKRGRLTSEQLSHVASSEVVENAHEVSSTPTTSSAAGTEGRSVANVSGRTLETLSVSSNIPRFQVPNEIYKTVPPYFFPIVTTLPSPSTDIPESFIDKIDDIPDENITLVYDNNGYISYQVEDSFGIEGTRRLMIDLGQAEETITEQTLKPVWSLLTHSKEFRTAIETKTSIDLDNYRVKQIRFDNSKQPTLKQIILNGRSYGFDEFVDSSAELFPGFEPERQSYLYRAITDKEWSEIKNKRHMVIRSRDNFEDNVGPQVSDYVSSNGYAGVIVKIPVKGKFFGGKGMQVPRIECLIPHFVHEQEIKVSADKGKTFIQLSDFLRST